MSLYLVSDDGGEGPKIDSFVFETIRAIVIHFSFYFFFFFRYPNLSPTFSEYSSIDKVKKMPRGASGTSKKAGKDPNAPKRPLSAFFLFSQDERPEIKKKNPSMSVGDISKEIGARWKKVRYVDRYYPMMDKSHVHCLLVMM